MAIKNIYLADDQGNELYPKTTVENILNPEKLTDSLAKADEVLNLKAGAIKSGDNLNTVTDNGFFAIQGVNSATLKNIPSDINEPNLWAVILNVNVSGLHQYWLQGAAIYVRSKIGNPEEWTKWGMVNQTTLEPMETQTAFLAQRVSALEQGGK